MYPSPDVILACPHCEALYRRSNDLDENGMDRWSDGKLCTDIDVDWYLDLIIRCTSCGRLFVTHAARKQNKWGFNIPKDIKFYPAYPLTIEESIALLHDEKMLNAIGPGAVFPWFMDSGLDEKDEQVKRLAGEISIRLTIWSKLNDLIRYSNNRSWTTEEKRIYKENAQTLLQIIPNEIVDMELLLVKAELHRNLKQFISSLLVLRRINTTSSKFTRKKLIRLNLLLRSKLTKLNRVPFRRTPFGRKVKQLQYRIEDFFSSFRKK